MNHPILLPEHIKRVGFKGINKAFYLTKEQWSDTQDEQKVNSSLPKYLSNFPYFTGFSAHSLVK